MKKIVSLMRRREGMTRDEFRTYYETVHVPLITRLVPGWVDYRRNYVVDQSHRTAHQPTERALDTSVDVITEMTFSDETGYRRAVDALSDASTAAVISADEERLFDRSLTRTFVVDEFSSTAPTAG
ncbi:EthD domain-containing protein [Microbacterium sp. NPDC055357]